MDSFVIRTNPKPVSTKSPLNIYTDGACSNNGKASAKAGFGVCGLGKMTKEIPVNPTEADKQTMWPNC